METKKVKIFENGRVLAVYIICNLLTVMTVIGSIIMTISTHDRTVTKLFEHIGLCVLAVFFFNWPLIARVKLKLRIPPFLQITVTIFAIAHFVFGEIYRFYDSSIVFDKILHTISGIMFGIYGFSLINALNGKDNPLFKLSPFFVVVFSFCFSLAIGYIWEIMEYTADSIFRINAQRWQDSFYMANVNGEQKLVSDYSQGSGLIDTMGDMIVSMIGAAFISCLGYIWLKRKSKIMNKMLIKKFPNDNLPKANIPEPDNNNDFSESY